MPTHRAYNVQRRKPRTVPDSLWQGPFWTDAPALAIDQPMGRVPDHVPVARAKILYDSNNLYVLFHVRDRYVKCVAAQYGDPVWQDSCVEFFFTAGADSSPGYFNIEINACGVLLMAHQKARDVQRVAVAPADASRIRIQHSLPASLEHEIVDPVEWTIRFALPFDMLTAYARVRRPARGVIWRANLYKCGDNTTKPHWLTWSKIDRPEPDFHRPEFFGTLLFQ